MSQKLESSDRSGQRGKLRIGNDWNAITIIALSQSNPLKAIAELVENSIDARATHVTIVRGRMKAAIIWRSGTTGKAFLVERTAGRTSAMSRRIFATR